MRLWYWQSFRIKITWLQLYWGRPYELAAIGYTTTHLSACQPEGIHTFRSYSHKLLTINYLSHLLSSSQSNSKTVPPKVILALDNSLAIFAVKQRCQVTVFRLQEIVHQRRVSNVCQLYQCLQAIYNQKLRGNSMLIWHVVYLLLAYTRAALGSRQTGNIASARNTVMTPSQASQSLFNLPLPFSSFDGV